MAGRMPALLNPPYKAKGEATPQVNLMVVSYQCLQGKLVRSGLLNILRDRKDQVWIIGVHFFHLDV